MFVLLFRFAASVAMQINIRLFAFQAQIAGREVILSLAEGATAADAVAALKGQFPAMRWADGTLVAVNMEYVSLSQALKPGDTLAIIPPVSGGTA